MIFNKPDRHCYLSAARVGADRCVLISRTANPVQGDKIASLDLTAALDLLLEGAGA